MISEIQISFSTKYHNIILDAFPASWRDVILSERWINTPEIIAIFDDKEIKCWEYQKHKGRILHVIFHLNLKTRHGLILLDHITKLTKYVFSWFALISKNKSAPNSAL